MLFFLSDYTEGAHPKVLERLTETNLISQPGYGDDEYCAAAADKLRALCGLPGAGVYFLTGGTQANLVVISSLLRRYEAVVAADTGHIAVHEAGAIEYSGHKVIALPAQEGRLEAGALTDYCQRFYADATHPHMPFPGTVYLSFPTELGTLYTKAELTAISEVCREYGMRLYIDGARLGCGLMSPECDLTLPELAALCDVFTLGGTKLGALCGEALVFTGGLPAHFATLVKQQGAMLAKGRLLGVQFDALLSDGLYWSLARKTVGHALALKAAFVEKGYPLFLDSPTNQQFVILTDEQCRRLSSRVAFNVWEPLPDGRCTARFVTSWATKAEDIEKLKALL